MLRAWGGQTDVMSGGWPLLLLCLKRRRGQPAVIMSEGRAWTDPATYERYADPGLACYSTHTRTHTCASAPGRALYPGVRGGSARWLLPRAGHRRPVSVCIWQSSLQQARHAIIHQIHQHIAGGPGASWGGPRGRATTCPGAWPSTCRAASALGSWSWRAWTRAGRGAMQRKCICNDVFGWV